MKMSIKEAETKANSIKSAIEYHKDIVDTLKLLHSYDPHPSNVAISLCVRDRLGNNTSKYFSVPDAIIRSVIIERYEERLQKAKENLCSLNIEIEE